MDGSAVNEIKNMLDLAAVPVDIDGKKYTRRQIIPVLPGKPATLEVESLTGLADFIDNNRDGLSKEDMSILVSDEKTVELYGRLGDFTSKDSSWSRTRPLLCCAKMNKGIEIFPFGRFMDHETFVIKILCLFKWAEKDLAAFLEKVKSIKREDSLKSEDNGVTTTRTKTDGIQINSAREVVKLRPFRTFSESVQPETSFILRATLKGEEVNLALFECDGGAWLNEARENVKTWLKEKIKDVPIFA